MSVRLNHPIVNQDSLKGILKVSLGDVEDLNVLVIPKNQGYGL